jgi:hypothetical protein
VGTERNVIQVTEYDLADAPDAYVRAIGRLAARTESEGHQGVLQYRFFVNPDEGTAGSTIVYEDAAAWRAHHEIAYQWEEMGALQATVQLKNLILYGPLTDEITGSLGGASISYTHYPQLAAGFVRT